MKPGRQSTTAFRQATETDAPTIAQLHAESWQNTYRGILTDTFLDGPVLADRRKTWKERLTNPAENQYVLLAETDGQPSGFVCAFWHDDAVFGTLIDNLHVHKSYQGRGIGRQLMGHVTHWLQQHTEQERFYLWVLEKNYATIKFYESVGGINHESAVHLMPDGQRHNVFRYVWRDFDLIQDQESGIL